MNPITKLSSKTLLHFRRSTIKKPDYCNVNTVNCSMITEPESLSENVFFNSNNATSSSRPGAFMSAKASPKSQSSPMNVLGLNGLKNIGNTCFMNTVIQCLSPTKWLLEYLRKDAYIRDINTSISSMKEALIKAFAELISELWSEDAFDRVVNTVSLNSQIQRFVPHFIGYEQQDAEKILRHLLEGLHEDVNRVTEKPESILLEIDEKFGDDEKATESWARYLRLDNSKSVDHLVGQLKSTLRCTHCGHRSFTFDPFWDLSLYIPHSPVIIYIWKCK